MPVRFAEDGIVLSYRIDKLFLFFAFTICNSSSGKVKFTLKFIQLPRSLDGSVFEHVEMIDIEPVVADRRFGE
jgi:hypothetical protein